MGREVNQRGDGGLEGGGPRVLRVPPPMMAPRLPLMRGQNPPYGRGRGSRNAPHRSAARGGAGGGTYPHRPPDGDAVSARAAPAPGPPPPATPPPGGGG